MLSLSKTIVVYT